ncbi:hypothetical protein DFH09DRAFT_1362509 [Mycena vulgaris]|nr:hypothetical protein DFH09DRAFT_1362509 [Mycena vulgaris]
MCKRKRVVDVRAEILSSTVHDIAVSGDEHSPTAYPTSRRGALCQILVLLRLGLGALLHIIATPTFPFLALQSSTWTGAPRLGVIYGGSVGPAKAHDAAGWMVRMASIRERAVRILTLLPPFSDNCALGALPPRIPAFPAPIFYGRSFPFPRRRTYTSPDPKQAPRVAYTPELRPAIPMRTRQRGLRATTEGALVRARSAVAPCGVAATDARLHEDAALRGELRSFAALEGSIPGIVKEPPCARGSACACQAVPLPPDRGRGGPRSSSLACLRMWAQLVYRRPRNFPLRKAPTLCGLALSVCRTIMTLYGRLSDDLTPERGAVRMGNALGPEAPSERVRVWRAWGRPCQRGRPCSFDILRRFDSGVNTSPFVYVR